MGLKYNVAITDESFSKENSKNINKLVTKYISENKLLEEEQKEIIY
ncbi:hypothetical protein [Methanobrevibacter curvatus]|nr:hypothetical protein [Methanobrevibacter curvatus]